MTVTGLDHVCVSVRNLDASLEFYHGLLGIPVLGIGEEENPAVPRAPGAAAARYWYADLDLGDGRILELLEHRTPAGRHVARTPVDLGLAHLSLQVRDLDAAIAALSAAQLTPISPVFSVDSPAWWKGVRAAYFLDPDGATVELLERRPRVAPGRGKRPARARPGGSRASGPRRPRGGRRRA